MEKLCFKYCILTLKRNKKTVKNRMDGQADIAWNPHSVYISVLRADAQLKELCHTGRRRGGESTAA